MSILPSDVDFSLDSFPFQHLEKNLSYGVVVAATSTAHATDQAVGL